MRLSLYALSSLGRCYRVPHRATLEPLVPDFARIVAVGVVVTRRTAVIALAITTGISGNSMAGAAVWLGDVALAVFWQTGSHCLLGY